MVRLRQEWYWGFWNILASLFRSSCWLQSLGFREVGFVCFERAEYIPFESLDDITALSLSHTERKSCGQEFNTPVPFFLPASVTLSHHYPACVATHHCNQVAIESVGDVTFTTQKNCCFGDLCNGAVASSVTPLCVLAAVVTTLAWLLPGP